MKWSRQRGDTPTDNHEQTYLMHVALTVVCCCRKCVGGRRPVAFYLKPAKPLHHGHVYCEQAPHHYIYAAKLQQLSSNHIISLRDGCSKTFYTASLTPLIAIERAIFDEQGLSREQIHRRRGQTCYFATYTPVAHLLFGFDVAHVIRTPNY